MATYPNASSWRTGSPGSAWWTLPQPDGQTYVCSWTGREIIRRAQSKMNGYYGSRRTPLTVDGIIGDKTMDALIAYATEVAPGMAAYAGWTDLAAKLQADKAAKRVTYYTLRFLAWLAGNWGPDSLDALNIPNGTVAPVYGSGSALPTSPQTNPTCAAQAQPATPGATPATGTTGGTTGSAATTAGTTAANVGEIFTTPPATSTGGNTETGTNQLGVLPTRTTTGTTGGTTGGTTTSTTTINVAPTPSTTAAAPAGTTPVAASPTGLYIAGGVAAVAALGAIAYAATRKPQRGARGPRGRVGAGRRPRQLGRG